MSRVGSKRSSRAESIASVPEEDSLDTRLTSSVEPPTRISSPTIDESVVVADYDAASEAAATASDPIELNEVLQLLFAWLGETKALYTANRSQIVELQIAHATDVKAAQAAVSQLARRHAAETKRLKEEVAAAKQEAASAKEAAAEAASSPMKAKRASVVDVDLSSWSAEVDRLRDGLRKAEAQLAEEREARQVLLAEQAEALGAEEQLRAEAAAARAQADAASAEASAEARIEAAVAAARNEALAEAAEAAKVELTAEAEKEALRRTEAGAGLAQELSVHAAGLQQQLDDAGAQVEAAKAEAEAAKAEVEAAKAEAEAAKAEVDEAKAEADEAIAKAAVADLAAKAASSAIADAAAAAEERCIEHAAEAERARADAAALGEQLETARAEASALVEQLETTRTEASAAALTLEELRVRHVKTVEELDEIKGTVRVLCRLRPLRAHDEALRGASAVPAPPPPEGGPCRSVIVQAPNASQTTGGTAKGFEFDRVFGAEHSSSDVFEELRPLTRKVASGANAAILAYGQVRSRLISPHLPASRRISPHLASSASPRLISRLISHVRADGLGQDAHRLGAALARPLGAVAGDGLLITS